MSYYISLVLSLAIFIPAVIGLVLIKKINPVYYPFILLIWIGGINELVNFYLISNGKSNAANTNIYFLIESLLITYQFRKWNLFQRKNKLFSLLIYIFLLSWVIEVFMLSTIAKFASYYSIFFSFVVVMMSISMINILIVHSKGKLIKNPIFIICAGFILFFTNAIIVEAFYQYGLMLSKRFQVSVVRVMTFTNLFINILYSFAVLWMPKRQKFSPLY